MVESHSELVEGGSWNSGTQGATVPRSNNLSYAYVSIWRACGVFTPFVSVNLVTERKPLNYSFYLPGFGKSDLLNVIFFEGKTYFAVT